MDSPQSGRAAFEKGQWAAALDLLKIADARSALDAEDLDRLATAAHLTGDDKTGIDARTRAHQAFLDRGDAVRAFRCAFWLGFALSNDPTQQAQASGWLARGRRLLEERGQEDCAERGFVLCGTAFMKVGTGDIAGANEAFAQAARIGTRFKDTDLTALARHGEGRTLLYLNRAAEGFAILDEVMVSVTCGELGALATGAVYCSVIAACCDLFDLRRAQEWTDAMSRWCAAHPDMQLFRGECLVQRSQLLQLHGSWRAALEEAERACERLAASPGPAIGNAYYQRADVHRLRGELDEAEVWYRRAAQAGRKPQPGLALVRLARGDAGTADMTIRGALAESRLPRQRVYLLRAAVEIALARNDLAAARADAAELQELAERLAAPFARGAWKHASAAAALAAGEPSAATALLRDACTEWQELDAPYEIAQTRALLGIAYRTLGDEDGAELELEAASEVFDRLGASADVARLAGLLTAKPAHASGPLTGREVEVLRLVAAGKTNKAIASELGISEKTVARHLSNIFTKLDLPSRSAATAYAYEHKLV